ncbi:hypothetical protein CBR_g8703 [Chara braunii]|uniref:Protein kinase domain-containing protein n=1 Tax=Chara braunii TaxID=69332 RepID=A0A388KML0_CHABU|nr:hypothetical protein CBR_g8703 [Chara braunii]|eukprot:GBG71281.1 hypothetical protein CBR_g8703 [Chara braunii]
MAVHPTLSYLISSFTHDGKDDVALWDWEKGWEKIVFKGHSKAIRAVAFHPTNLQIFASASDDGTLKVWNIEKRSVMHTMQDHGCIPQIWRLQFCSRFQNPLLITCGKANVAKVWNYKAASCIAKLEGNDENVWGAFFHPHLPYIFTADEAGNVKLWNESTYQRVFSCPCPSQLCGIFQMYPCISPNRNILCSCEGFLVLEVVEEQSVVLMRTLRRMEKLEKEAAFSKEGTRLRMQELESILKKEVFTARQKSDKSCNDLMERIRFLEAEKANLVNRLEKISQRVEDLEGKLEEVTKQQRLLGSHLGVGGGPAERTSLSLFREYSVKELRDATDNFDKWKSGDGDPYGYFFLGKLAGQVWVKKIRAEVMVDDDPNQERFKSSVVDRLRSLHHPHLLRLMGACNKEKCLVYEHAANGSVMDRILIRRDRSGTGFFPWYVRLRIIAQVARALSFLHSAHPPLAKGPIIHGAIKTANILLDDKLVAKALIRQELKERGQAQRTTMLMYLANDSQYVAPEYWRSRILDEKTDVYAFGITVLEILTGKMSNAYETIESAVEDDGAFRNALDPNADGWDMELTRKVARLGLQCASLDMRHRPGMTSGDESIISILERVSLEVDLPDFVEDAR